MTIASVPPGGCKKKRLYLLDVLRQRFEYPQLKRAVQSQAERFRADNILIEDKASGTQLIQDLTQDGMYGITPYEPAGLDKIMRLNSVTGAFESGRVYLPKEADWLECYVHELTTFPAGKHDDQTDRLRRHWTGPSSLFIAIRSMSISCGKPSGTAGQ